jgi:phage gpG-like protein
VASEGEARVKGYAELERGSKTLFEHIAEEAPKAFSEVADSVAASVGATVPRLSGALAGSVTAMYSGDRATLGMGEGIPYAGWIEFGGSRGRPYVPEGRYLFPAALDAEEQIIAAGVEAADKEIGDMRWPSPS